MDCLNGTNNPSPILQTTGSSFDGMNNITSTIVVVDEWDKNDGKLTPQINEGKELEETHRSSLVSSPKDAVEAKEVQINVNTAKQNVCHTEKEGCNGIEPLTNHILCVGKDTMTNSHPANKVFSSLIDGNKMVYGKSSFDIKDLISRTIVQTIQAQTPPGKFLEKCISTGKWFDIGLDKTMKTIHQALRHSYNLETNKGREMEVESVDAISVMEFLSPYTNKPSTIDYSSRISSREPEPSLPPGWYRVTYKRKGAAFDTFWICPKVTTHHFRTLKQVRQYMEDQKEQQGSQNNKTRQEIIKAASTPSKHTTTAATVTVSQLGLTEMDAMEKYLSTCTGTIEIESVDAEEKQKPSSPISSLGMGKETKVKMEEIQLHTAKKEEFLSPTTSVTASISAGSPSPLQRKNDQRKTSIPSGAENNDNEDKLVKKGIKENLTPHNRKRGRYKKKKRRGRKKNLPDWNSSAESSDTDNSKIKNAASDDNDNDSNSDGNDDSDSASDASNNTKSPSIRDEPRARVAGSRVLRSRPQKTQFYQPPKRSLPRSSRKEKYETDETSSPEQSKTDENDHHSMSSSQGSQESRKRRSMSDLQGNTQNKKVNRLSFQSNNATNENASSTKSSKKILKHDLFDTIKSLKKTEPSAKSLKNDEPSAKSLKNDLFMTKDPSTGEYLKEPKIISQQEFDKILQMLKDKQQEEVHPLPLPDVPFQSSPLAQCDEKPKESRHNANIVSTASSFPNQPSQHDSSHNYYPQTRESSAHNSATQQISPRQKEIQQRSWNSNQQYPNSQEQHRSFNQNRSINPSRQSPLQQPQNKAPNREMWGMITCVYPTFTIIRCTINQPGTIGMNVAKWVDKDVPYKTENERTEYCAVTSVTPNTQAYFSGVQVGDIFMIDSWGTSNATFGCVINWLKGDVRPLYLHFKRENNRMYTPMKSSPPSQQMPNLIGHQQSPSSINTRPTQISPSQPSPTDTNKNSFGFRSHPPSMQNQRIHHVPQANESPLHASRQVVHPSTSSFGRHSYPPVSSQQQHVTPQNSCKTAGITTHSSQALSEIRPCIEDVNAKNIVPTLPLSSTPPIKQSKHSFVTIILPADELTPITNKVKKRPELGISISSSNSSGTSGDCRVITADPAKHGYKLGLRISDVFVHSNDSKRNVTFQEVMGWIKNGKRPFTLVVKRRKWQYRKKSDAGVNSEGHNNVGTAPSSTGSELLKTNVSTISGDRDESFTWERDILCCPYRLGILCAIHTLGNREGVSHEEISTVMVKMCITSIFNDRHGGLGWNESYFNDSLHTLMKYDWIKEKEFIFYNPHGPSKKSSCYRLNRSLETEQLKCLSFASINERKFDTFHAKTRVLSNGHPYDKTTKENGVVKQNDKDAIAKPNKLDNKLQEKDLIKSAKDALENAQKKQTEAMVEKEKCLAVLGEANRARIQAETRYNEAQTQYEEVKKRLEESSQLLEGAKRSLKEVKSPSLVDDSYEMDV